MAQCPINNMTPKDMIERASKKKEYTSNTPARPLHTYRLPPGPNPNSDEADFITNEKQIYRKIFDWYIPRYGPVMTIYKENTPCIVISDIDIAYEIFVNKYSKQVAGRTANYGERLLSGNRNNILNSDYGGIWKILQRYLHRGLRYCGGIDRMNEIMEVCFGKLRENIDYRGGSKQNGIKMEEDLFWTSDNVMTMLLFNEIYSDSEYNRLQKVLLEIPDLIEQCEFDNPRGRSEGQAAEKLKASLNKLFPLLQKKIDEHRIRGDYKISCLDITDFLLLGVEEYKIDPVARKLNVELTNLHVKHVIIDAIFASQEGLGNTFLWVTGLLALHPHIQEKIRQELDLFQDDCRKTVSLEWKSKMPYTNAALHEMQRFACADTFTDFHVALDDINIRGQYEIPRNALVLLNIYAIHHTPIRWDQPEKLIPERFLSEDGSKFKRRKDCIPYGMGLRTCTGNIFSENVLFLFILHLVNNYRLVWGKNKSQRIVDDQGAVFIRDIQPFNVQFIPLK